MPRSRSASGSRRRSGTRARFAELYEAHFERVYAYAVRRVRDRHEAEDVTAEVFHQALANLRPLRMAGRPLRGLAVPYRRQRDRRPREARGPRARHAGVRRLEPEPALERIEERCGALPARCGSFRADQRRVIEMRFTEGKTVREIAGEMGRTEGAVKKNLQLRAVQEACASARVRRMAERDLGGPSSTIWWRRSPRAPGEGSRAAGRRGSPPSGASRWTSWSGRRRFPVAPRGRPRKEGGDHDAGEGRTTHPKGLHSLMPYLIVPEGDRFIEFARRAFDADAVYRASEPDGPIVHAALRIGDSVFELSEGSAVAAAPGGDPPVCPRRGHDVCARDRRGRHDAVPV